MALFKKKDQPNKQKRPKKKADAKQKEPQFYKSATGDVTINYRVYYLSAAEKIGYFLVGFLAGGAVGYLFYGGIGKDSYGDPTMLTYILNTVVVAVCGILTGRVLLPIRQQQILESRQSRLKSQFRDMLEAISTSMGSGKNVPESFLAAYHDLKNQYEEDAFILQELKIINTGLENGINIEVLLSDFGNRSGCADIQDFAGVFDICYRRGGNIKETIQNTCSILGDKMNIMEEIQTTVAGSKNEQYIMLVMPILLIGLIKVTSPEFAANFATPAGIAATTIGVIMFVASYFVGKKLLSIKV